jgi:hypothetical protein
MVEIHPVNESKVSMNPSSRLDLQAEPVHLESRRTARKGIAMHRYTIASAFALMAVIGSAAVAAPLPDFHTPKPNLPDLSVVYIERNPKFPGTIIEWHHVDEGPNGNKGDAANSPISNPTVQKWPTPGQTVTFTAHVKNKGPVAAPRFDWHFLIDGKDVDGGETAALAPGAETTYEIKWKWLTGDHWVSFEVDRAQVIDEISMKNNFVVDQVNAMGFHFFVQKDVYDWFDTIMSAMLSYSWEDWAQFQVREMNRTFRDDIYPAAPDGIKMRVRIDQIIILPNSYKDPDGTHAPIINATGGCDGVWGFTNSLLQKNKDTGKNVYEANPELIFAPEWSLLHELGHQLGQPDYYCMPIPKEHNKAAPGMPYSPGHGYQDIMMFSGNWSHASALGKDKVPWNSTYRFWESTRQPLSTATSVSGEVFSLTSWSTFRPSRASTLSTRRASRSQTPELSFSGPTTRSTVAADGYLRRLQSLARPTRTASGRSTRARTPSYPTGPRTRRCSSE